MLAHGSISLGHIYVTVYRSHFNQNIFSRTPYRFTMVPICLVAIFYYVPVILAAALVVELLWGYYHYAMQAFGIGRVYDKKRGNAGDVGRWADYGLLLVMFLGPMLAGVNMIEFLVIPRDYGVESGIGFLVDVFNAANDLRVDVSRGVMLIGGTYVVFYCAYYVHLFKRGYIVSWQKYTMLVITAVFNIVACGTLHAGVAYFINELYHAAQYLVFVWFYERKNMSNLTVRSVYKKLVLACAVIATFAAGCWMYLSAGGDSLLGVCIVLTCLLMHYWWDGFIWSVRRKQV